MASTSTVFTAKACLKATARFSAFDLVDVNNGALTWTAASASKAPSSVLVGGRLVTLEEVGRVAMLNASVTLDAGAIEKVDKSSKGASGGSKGVTTTTTVQTDVAAAPVEVCRAAIFARIVSLMQGTSRVCSCTIQLLVDMLEYDVVPVLHNTDNVGVELVAALEGSCSAAYYGAASLDEKSLDAVHLTATERDVLSSDASFLVTGATCLVAAGALHMTYMVDIVGALSSEAVGMDTSYFDVSNYESGRQHRGQIASATIFQQMMQGTKVTGKGISGQSFDQDAFVLSPQMHGPAIDIIATAARAAQVELNSYETGPNAPGVAVSQSKLSLVSLASALEVLAAASTKRCAVVLKTSANFDFATSIVADLGYGLMIRTTEAFVAELVSANKALDTLGSPSGEPVAANEGDAEANDAATAAVSASSKKTVVDPTLTGMTDAQKAKIMAKRKAKADKAAAKAAAKSAKKGSGSGADVGPSSGNGTYELRKFLAKEKILGNKYALNPFNMDETNDSFAAYCKEFKGKLASSTFRKLGIPPGTRDYTPAQMRIREQVLTGIRRVFKRHGAVEIDTPVFELRDVLMGKYGEDSKLIYDLADQGGELLSMRYDLTVPFARFLAMNSVGNIKRFHIAKVYRRDAPQMKRGRYREFYQCDFDVAGTYPPLVPDAEVLSVACEILRDLNVGEFVFKLNHRKLLDAIFEIAGVPEEKFRPICSAVDKLDKMSWEDVKVEMTEEKGLAPEVADKIGTFVRQAAKPGQPYELLALLKENADFKAHPNASAALADMTTLMDYLGAMGSLPNIQFDLSLARGLDYYTGVIYEAVLVGGSAVGSISAGGRYDNLVGMFSSSGQQTPCVGVSIGVERCFTIIEQKAEAEGQALQGADIQVYVAAIEGFTADRMKIAKLLWDANISAEYSYQAKPKLKRQLDEVLDRGIPYMIVFGEAELAAGVVNVKDIANKTQDTVKLEDMVATLRSKGCKLVTDDPTSLLG